MVVDCFVQDGKSVSRALLDHLGIGRIDLLVLTHPDADHFSGLPQLVHGLDVRLVWRFRGASRLTDLVAYWLRTKGSADARLARLHEGLAALALLEEAAGDTFEASAGLKPWRRSDYEVHCVAPAQYDLSQFALRLQGLIDMGQGSIRLSRRLMDVLDGTRRSLGEPGNPLSLAVVLKWGTVGVLLSGDVENGDGSPRSGWRGAMRYLDRAGELDLIRGLTVVKMAHHGSSGAFLEEAWRLHAAPKVQAALLTPFNRGVNPPPHGDVLVSLKDRAERLVVTGSASGLEALCHVAAWRPRAEDAVAAESGAWAAAVISRDGSLAVSVGEPACSYEQRRKTK